MKKSEIVALYDLDQRINVEYPDTRREEFPCIVRHVGLDEFSEGTILYSQLNEDNVDQTICEQIDYYETIGQNFEWKLFDYDRPADLKARLLAYGFENEESEAIMVLDLHQTPEILRQPVRHDVRSITHPSKLSDVLAVEQQVWNEDHADLKFYLSHTLTRHPDQMSIYAAYVDNRPVSAAWIYYPLGSQFASLWGGSTLVEFRGRGLYTALLAARVQEAIKRRVSYLAVDASPMSRPILEKFGFEKIATCYPCKWVYTAHQK